MEAANIEGGEGTSLGVSVNVRSFESRGIPCCTFDLSNKDHWLPTQSDSYLSSASSQATTLPSSGWGRGHLGG